MKVVYVKEKDLDNAPEPTKKLRKPTRAESALDWMKRQEAKDRRKASKMFEAEKIAIGMIPAKK